MRFQKTIATLFVGALVLGPSTGAFAEEPAVDTQNVVAADAPAAQPTAEPAPPAEDPAAAAPEAAEQPEDEAAAPAPEDARALEAAPDLVAGQTTAPQEPGVDDSGEPAAAAVASEVTLVDPARQTELTAVAVGAKLQADVELSKPADLEVSTETEWFVNGQAVPAAAIDADGLFTVRAEDLGKTVTAEVTHTWGATPEYTADSLTEATSVGAVVKRAAQVSATAKIVGTPKIGNTLTGKTVDLKMSSELPRKAGVYTWYSNGKKVATGKTYTVKPTDFKKRITVTANVPWGESKTMFAGSITTKPSAATAAVTKHQAKVSISVKVSGWAKAGKSLSAKATVKKPGDLKFSGTYIWTVSGKKVKTGTSIKVTPAMVGKNVSVIYQAKWGSTKYTYTSKSIKKTYRATAADSRPAKMVRSAKAQLGDFQDCTVLIERALRFSGKKVGDLGTRAGEYTSLGGTRVGSPVPGDVLIWEGRHVAMYIGNGKAVHSGYAGNQTVIASAYIDGSPSAIVRYK
ncbi:hypothetical protein D3248_00880 [Leucobacter zeae]|nr:hypothetical protein [Leucobacter zeae]